MYPLCLLSRRKGKWTHAGSNPAIRAIFLVCVHGVIGSTRYCGYLSTGSIPVVRSKIERLIMLQVDERYFNKFNDTHWFFYSGPLSNFFHSPFKAKPLNYFKELEFQNSEQYIMLHKALLFSDFEMAKNIMDTSSPAEAKKFGRFVKNFDEDLWAKERKHLVFHGLLQKFLQNEICCEYLLLTGNRYLVEASPTDKIWGIGIGMVSHLLENPKNWKGTNLLGIYLMNIRDKLKYELHHSKQLKEI